VAGLDDAGSGRGHRPQAQERVPRALVYDMDDLQQVTEANQEQRPCEAAESEESTQAPKQLAARRAALQELSPTIIALMRRLEQIRSTELARHRRRLGALEPSQHRAIEALTRNILNKVLHGSVCELKAHAGAPEQHVLAQLVRRLFRVA